MGKLTLDRNPENFFAEVEQAALDPANFVPGIGPSPDRMLQARLFAYGDAHRYRLGINSTQLPVNSPHGVKGGARNYGRDGAMRFDGNGGRGPNYEPNSFGGPAQTDEAPGVGYAVSGLTGTYVHGKHAEDNDFVQAGALYRLMTEPQKQRLVENISGSLAQVSRDDIIARAIAHFRAADEEYGSRIATSVQQLRRAR